MNADDPAVAIRNAIRDRLQRLAGELGDLAELSSVGDVPVRPGFVNLDDTSAD